MFKVYDLSLKEIPLPMDSLRYGLHGLDIEIGPVEYESTYAKGNSAVQFHKRIARDRKVSIEMFFISRDVEDWTLKRDSVYKFFRKLGVFYVAEEFQPKKLLKVTVDEAYNFEKPVIVWGKASINLKILDTPFKQSLHTSLDIHDNGIKFDGRWPAGMGTLSDSTTWKYRFANEQPRFLNIGDEPIKLIQFKSYKVKIDIDSAATFLEIYDGHRTFRLNQAVKASDVLIIKGGQVTLNGNNVLSNTNFTFLEVLDGWNQWEVRGPAKFQCSIDIKFLYD